jgi:phosphate transport system permease protein
MPETAASHFRYFVSPRSNGDPGDGTPERPLRSVQDALRDIADRHAGASPKVRKLGGYDRVDICSVAQPNASPSNRRPRYEFYVEPLGTNHERGTGTALFPWSNLETALDHVAQLDKQGALPLGPGEHIRLAVREMFSATPVGIKKLRMERIAKLVFLAMTTVLVIPLFAIFAHLLYKAWPVLTPTFVFENPHNHMTAGGVWAPLVGTFYLVFMSLLVAAPIGVLAGVYLNEYARDNWFTRIVNLAVVNLAGVPSIVHALFGVGAFVMFAGMGESVLAASCTLAIMLPNSISGILTGMILQVSRAAGETAPILFTGAAYFMTVPNKGWRHFFPYSLGDGCMALSYHLHVLLTQVKGASADSVAQGKSLPLEQLQYGTAVVLIGLVLVVNSASIGLRLYLRSRKKW